MGGGKNDDRPFRYHFVAGTAGGMVGLLVCFPFDTAKTFIQMHSATYGNNMSTIKLLSTMAKRNGVFSIYKGVLYPWVGYGAIFSTAFGVRGTVQDLLKKHYHVDDKYAPKKAALPFYETMFCGMCAGGASAIVRTPIERVKVWSQLNKQSTFTSTRQLLSEYGLKSGTNYIYHLYIIYQLK